MNNQLSKERENKLKETFGLIDHDKDNYINSNEVGLLLRGLGIYLTEEDIVELNKELIQNGNDKVTYEELKKIYIEKLKTNKTSKDLIQAFEFFDEEKTGKVNLNELKHGLIVLGDCLNEEEINYLINEIGDEDGNIDYKKLAKTIFEN
jgi:Ca2+-binding EF-hand superfamily protein